MILKIDAKFEEKPICCFKNDKNLVNFDPTTQVFKTCTVICLFCAKYITLDQKSTEELSLITLKSYAKFEEKFACSFENDERFEKFSSDYFKVSNVYS